MSRLHCYMISAALCVSACGASSSPRGASVKGQMPTSAAATSEQLAHEGLRRLAAGDSLRAEQYLQLAMQAGYPAASLIVPLLDACMASSRLRAALSHAETHLRAHPSAWRVRYLAAAIHVALGDETAALAELQRVLVARPDAIEALYLLGVLCRDALQDPERAAQTFHAYLAQAPEGDHAEELRAWLHERNGIAHLTNPAPAAAQGAL